MRDHTVLPATRQRWHSRPYHNRIWYPIYRPRGDARLSWPRHCSKAQPVPEAAYRSGCHDEHNRLRWDRPCVWARGRCRISPSRFLAECCKRQLNQGSLVLLYFRLSAFFWFVLSLFICIFLYCFVCQYQSSDWLWRPPPKWPILCRVGR